MINAKQIFKILNDFWYEIDALIGKNSLRGAEICSTQNRNPPFSVPSPSSGLHHLERFALFIVEYDK